jgi:hypothetical protein
MERYDGELMTSEDASFERLMDMFDDCVETYKERGV